jgi:hypothetical protein
MLAGKQRPDGCDDLPPPCGLKVMINRSGARQARSILLIDDQQFDRPPDRRAWSLAVLRRCDGSTTAARFYRVGALVDLGLVVGVAQVATGDAPLDRPSIDGEHDAVELQKRGALCDLEGLGNVALGGGDADLLLGARE